MGLINFILDLAALLLWINWRTHPQNAQRLAPPATLVGTLRRADAPRTRQWHYLAALLGLIFFRAAIYRFIGGAVHWTGSVDVAAVSVSFRSDDFFRMLVFSTMSFGVLLGVFLLSLLLLSLLNPEIPEAAPFQQFIRRHIGHVENWLWPLKLLLPLVAVGAAWWIASWLLTSIGALPPPKSGAHRVEQSLVVGLGGYLAWKYLIAGVLLLHVLNSYVYFGRHAFWNYLGAVARCLLQPFQRLPLRIGRVDLSPFAALVLVLFIAHIGEHGMPVSKNLKIPGLIDLYARLPF